MTLRSSNRILATLQESMFKILKMKYLEKLIFLKGYIGKQTLYFEYRYIEY